MKYRNLFDCLENAEDSTMEKITENAPELGNEQLERILDMSERKYNTKKRERINTEYTDGYGADAVAEGVEPYNRPAWVKFAATAAALVLTAGVLALSHNLLGRRGGVHETPEIPIVVATASVTTTGTTDAENAELTTVIADTDSTETGTAAADNATTVTEAAAVTSAPAQQSQENKADTNTPSSAAKTTNETVENVLSEAECMNVINSYLDERITCSGMRTVLSDYLDTSDTFTTKFTITFDDVYESDGSHRLPEEYTITFVHYVNPKFRTLAEMRDYVYSAHDKWGDQISIWDIDELLGRTIVPGQSDSSMYYNQSYMYPFTEYNGKIYQATAGVAPEDMVCYQSSAEFIRNEKASYNRGKHIIKNITADSFEDYEVYIGPYEQYYGMYSYYYNNNGTWRTDASRKRELDDSECRTIMS